MSDYGDALLEVRRAISEVAADIFPDACDVKNAQVATPGATGGKVRGSTSVHENVPCGYRPLRGFERNAAGGSNAFADYEVKMPAEISGAQNQTKPKHFLVVAARGTIPAFTVEVVNVRNDRGIYLLCDVVLKN